MEKQKILVVDDMVENIHLLIETLKDEYALIAATSGSKALELAIKEPVPDLILLDIQMPLMDGYEVCRRLKQEKRSRYIPVIFVTSLNEDINETMGLEIGAVDYIRKPIKPALVKSRIHNHLELKRYRDHLEEVVIERTREVILTQNALIESMGALAEQRDPETGGHINRTQHYIRALAEALKEHPDFEQELDDLTIDLLFKTAPLHDIGKVGVRDEILFKPAKLTTGEFEEMKKHVLFGTAAIKSIETKLGHAPMLNIAHDIIEAHHERWDGSGYPNGTKGRSIPLPGRLMALADVYDALISKRVYKEGFPHQQAVSIINEGSGNHFDPAIVDVFLKQQEQFREIALQFSDTEEE
ncbi:putative two-component system response regulator [Mariprofundus aestuarium]|uniref:Putative two-component system response regulator n=1 Tax=Mariprofundus aestuarium TaxID=1921086 RepID=A0A2K8L5B0_MARES|nr:HD domain-containing phosphohydrolase [Mariprofundus aestuarium]ATX79416.1 putative two-component system response regulator [Mariprofundus aestuarium]